MVHDKNLDLQCAFHLLAFFLKDLNRAVKQQELFNFLEVPQLYMTLYPALALSNRGSERTKNNDNNTINRDGRGSGGGSGRGLGGSSR